MSQIPLGYLDAAGQRAQIILPLTWFTLGVSILVCVIIASLVYVGVRRARVSGGAEQTRTAEVLRGNPGMQWIGIGVGISSVALLVTLVWTMVALAKSSTPANTPLTLDVTGRQWWWDVKYNAPEPDQSFTTANEIHIPVGVPVLVRLHGADVIHSFWVPKLSGKTDTIPGQTNVTWLQAAQPGRYRGQCMEYCGVQHAHMGFEVVAESQEDFQRWREHQLQPAPAPQTDQQKRGMELVVYRCGLCHEVRGTSAAAVVAPDLTHLMSRRTLAAGTLPNEVGTLGGWIEGAEQLKPGTLMPDQNLTGAQLTDTLAYLETLQ
jgi:cytochrome c oxidase subunit II